MKSSHYIKHSFLLATSITILASCSGDHKGNKEALLYSTSAQMSAVRDLTDEERAIATRICYAYQSKSSSFRSQTYLGGDFLFNIKSKDCSDKSLDYNVTSTLLAPDSTTLTFDPETDDKAFEGKIQTTQSGYLVKVCTKVQNNKVVSNTATEASAKVQISFSKGDLDSYTLKYFTSNGAGTESENMKIISAETFKVRTQFNLSGTQILGMDEIYSRQDTCANATDKHSDFIQTFTSFSGK